MADITTDSAVAYARPAYAGTDGVAMVAAGGICDLRHEVGEVKETVKDAECNITHHVKDAECNLQKSVMEAKYESKLQVIQTGKEVENRVSDLERNVDAMFCKTNENIFKEAALTREKSTELARWRDDKEEARFLRTWDKIEKNDDKLDAFRADVADRFCKENERELQSKIDELRAKVQCCECGAPTAGDVADTVIQKLVNLNILGSQK